MINFYKPSSRYILHVDGDSFFASCEVAVNHALRGKAVVTGKERGIVSAMTYEAKARGVSRGLPIFQLRKNFPDVIVISSNYELYSVFSRRMINIVRRYSDQVHEYSIDECFADLTEIIIERFKDAFSVVKSIKDDLQNELGLTFSLGLGPNKVLAKIASKTQKPNGLTIITQDNIKNFLQNVPIQKVWGIGRETSTLLFSKNIKTALDFAESSEEVIKDLVAKPYYEIYLELNGFISEISNFENSESVNYKSVSRTRTFFPSSLNVEIIFSELSKNVEEACAALRREKLVSGFFSFFLKDRDFRYYRFEVGLQHRTSSPEEILKMIRLNFNKVYRPGIIYRSTGVTLMSIRNEDIYTPDFFGTFIQVKKRRGLYKAIDALTRRQGSLSIGLASSLKSRQGREDREDSRSSFIFHLPYPYLGETH